MELSSTGRADREHIRVSESHRDSRRANLAEWIRRLRAKVRKPLEADGFDVVEAQDHEEGWRIFQDGGARSFGSSEESVGGIVALRSLRSRGVNLLRTFSTSLRPFG